MKKIYLNLAFFTLLGSASFAQTYVTPSGAGSKDGSSWANAFDGTQLQQAINLSSSGSQVWVAKGTFKPTENLSTTGFLTDGVTPVSDRDKAFILKAGVAIYGGFAGGETFGAAAIAARDLVGNETILSGDLNSNGIADVGDCYHVVSSRNTSLGATLDGFTIQHGFADGAGDITENGEVISQKTGAAACLNGTQTGTTFSNLIVKNNEATSTSAGIYAKGSNGYSFTNIKFESNTSGASGGGLFLNITGGVSTDVINCTFNNNKSAGDGGGAINYAGDSGSSINITNCTFSNNETTLYGGAIRLSSGIGNITGSSFINCQTITASSRGGAVYSTGSSILNLSSSTFKDNTSVTGGHYYIFSGTGNVNACTFENGTATGSGGAIYHAGTSDLNLTDCAFKNNNAATAGHYYISGGTGTIQNSTFRSGTASGNGGAIFASSAVVSLNILSSKFHLNVANGTTGGGAIYATSGMNISKTEFRSNTTAAKGGAIYLTSSATANAMTKISNSLFYDNIANNTGTANHGGGALYIDRYSGGTPTVTTSCTLDAINNTFYANKSPNAPTGAISFNGAATVIINLYNNIFNGNLGGIVSADIRPVNSAAMNFQNNLFQVFNQTATSNDTFSNNFLNDTPTSLFASVTTTDFNFLYPTSDSFVIDKGSDALYASVGDINTDTHLAGYARLSGAAIDLGAVEYSITLPVTISSFTAKLANNRTQLRWTVGTEDNVNRYEIERSQNGTDFVKVAETKATLANTYSVTDANPQIGVNYYRLKTVDNDGKFSHYGSLQTVNVSALTVASAKVYPNPVKGGLINVSLSGYPAGTYHAKLVSTAGVTVQQNIVNYDGAKDISFTSTAPAGIYILHLVNGDVKVQTKLIKQ